MFDQLMTRMGNLENFVTSVTKAQIFLETQVFKNADKAPRDPRKLPGKTEENQKGQILAVKAEDNPKEDELHEKREEAVATFESLCTAAKKLAAETTKVEMKFDPLPLRADSLSYHREFEEY